MEPWENAEERAAWHRVLVVRGASPDQAEVARLVRHGYRNEEIAALRNRSVSSVKEDVRILFALLSVTKRDRHVMGRVAARIVEGAAAAPSAAPALHVPPPELKLVRRRVARQDRGRGKGSAEPPAREA